MQPAYKHSAQTGFLEAARPGLTRISPVAQGSSADCIRENREGAPSPEMPEQSR